jgi:hypothetical protein
VFTHPAGALQKVPVVSPPDELAASALKRAVKVQPAAGLKNEAEKERSRAAKQLDTHMKVGLLQLICLLPNTKDSGT